MRTSTSLLTAIVAPICALMMPLFAWAQAQSTDDLLLEIIRPKTALNQEWLNTAQAALSGEGSAHSKLVIQALATHFKPIFNSKLKNEQVLFYKEMIAGMFMANREGLNRWPVEIAMNAVGGMIRKLEMAEQRLETSMPNPAELATGIESKLQVMTEKNESLRARYTELFKANGRLPTDSELLADSSYSATLLELRSCQATFFDGSENLNPILRNNVKLKDYLQDYTSNRVQPLLPVYTPQARYLKDMQGRVRNADGSPLSEAQAAHHIGIFLMVRKDEVIRRSRELRAYLTGEYQALRQEVRTGYETSDRAVKWLAHFPMATGEYIAGVAVLNKHVLPELNKASTYFSDTNQVFGDRMFYTGLASLTTLFIPGPNVAVGMGMTFKAGTLIYAALLATQAALITQHLYEFSNDNYTVNREEILNGSPFMTMKSDEIVRGLFDGSLNSAFLLTGEVFAGAQLGKDVLSRQFGNFISWARNKRSRLLKKRAMANHVVPIFKEVKDGVFPFMDNMVGLIKEIDQLKGSTKGPEATLKTLQETIESFNTRVEPIAKKYQEGILNALPLSPQGYARSRMLLQALEADPVYQNLLIETVRKIPNEMHRRVFMEILLEKAVIHAEIGGNYFTSRWAFLTNQRKAITELFESYSVNNKFTADMLSYVSQTPNPVTENVAKLRQMRDNAMQMLIDAAKAKIADPRLADMVLKMAQPQIQKVHREVVKKLEKKMRPLEKILRTRESRNEPYQFTRKFVDQIKKNALDLTDRVMADPEVRKLFFAGALDIESPAYSMRQAQFYIERAVAISEVIDEQIIRLSTQSGVSYSNFRESVLHALHKINEGPADFALKMVEITGIVSRLLVANNLSQEQRVNLQTRISTLNAVNCSLVAK